MKEIQDRDYKLDITWLKEESLEDELPEPPVLASEAITELEAVVDDLKEILQTLEISEDELLDSEVQAALGVEES